MRSWLSLLLIDRFGLFAFSYFGFEFDFIPQTVFTDRIPNWIVHRLRWHSTECLQCNHKIKIIFSKIYLTLIYLAGFEFFVLKCSVSASLTTVTATANANPEIVSIYLLPFMLIRKIHRSFNPPTSSTFDCKSIYAICKRVSLSRSLFFSLSSLLCHAKVPATLYSISIQNAFKSFVFVALVVFVVVLIFCSSFNPAPNDRF